MRQGAAGASYQTNGLDLSISNYQYEITAKGKSSRKDAGLHLGRCVHETTL